jgi:hypothetical protein
MTPSAAEISRSIYGAVRLARWDASGHEMFERTPEGALRSFFAAAIVAPAYLILLLLRYADMPEGIAFGRFLLTEGIAYAITWTAFPLVAWHFAAFTGRRDRYPGFLAAYNWSSVVQMTVYLPVIALGASELLPQALAEGVAMVVTLLMLAYQWFILRTGLAVGAAMAVGLLMLDVLISIFVSGMADTITKGG